VGRTWLQTVRPHRPALTVLRGTARGSARSVSSRTLSPPALCAQWVITAPSTEAVRISAGSWTGRRGKNLNLHRLMLSRIIGSPLLWTEREPYINPSIGRDLPSDPFTTWTRPSNFSTTQQPQPFSLNQPHDLSSKYMFAPQQNPVQFHYRSNLRLAHKVNCTCSLSSKLPKNNSFQPTAIKFDNYEAGISSPAQYIPASTPPPETVD
jgi:hypothetical protein